MPSAGPRLTPAETRTYSRRFVTRVVTAAIFGLAATLAAGAQEESRAQSMIGTLRTVSGQTLTVETKTRTETFTLVPTAKLRIGAKMVSPTDLVGHTGSRVKVRYTDEGGRKQARSVTVSSESRPAQRTPATSKK